MFVEATKRSAYSPTASRSIRQSAPERQWKTLPSCNSSYNPPIAVDSDAVALNEATAVAVKLRRGNGEAIESLDENMSHPCILKCCTQADHNSAQITLLRRRIMDIVPDDSNLYNEMDEFDHLCLCAPLYGMSKAERVAQFHLKAAGKRPFKAYSKGYAA